MSARPRKGGSEERREQFGDLAHPSPDDVLFGVLRRLTAGNGERLFKILAHGDERLCPVHEHGVLVVVDKGTVVKVDRSDDADLIVRQKSLCVDKSGRVLIDLHPAADQRKIVGAGERESDLFIGDMRRDETHVHPAFRRKNECLAQTVVDDEIGRHDPQIIARRVDDVDVHVLAYAARIDGPRPAAVRLHKALALKPFIRLRDIGRKVLTLPPRRKIVQLEKHQEQALDALAFKAHGGILPVPERGIDVHVLVRKIDPARVADLAVDDGDLAVIAVVVHIGHDGHERVELDALDAHLLDLSVIRKVHAPHTADVVVHEPHLDALLHFAREHVQHGIPELPFFDDEVLHEDVLFGPFEIGQQAVAEVLPHGEVLRFRPVVDAGGRIDREQRLADVRKTVRFLRKALRRDVGLFKGRRAAAQHERFFLHPLVRAVR